MYRYNCIKYYDLYILYLSFSAPSLLFLVDTHREMSLWSPFWPSYATGECGPEAAQNMVTPGGFRKWRFLEVKAEGSEGAEGPNKEENSGRRRFWVFQGFHRFPEGSGARLSEVPPDSWGYLCSVDPICGTPAFPGVLSCWTHSCSTGALGLLGGGSWLWLKGLARISCKMSLGVMDSNRMSGCNWLLHFCESLSITVSTGIQVTACKPATSKNHQVPMALGGEDIYTREI